MTKDGLRTPNYFGSLTQASTCRVGNFNGEEVHVPFKSLLPMVEPNDIVLGGWDISGMNLADSMERAKVGRSWKRMGSAASDVYHHFRHRCRTIVAAGLTWASCVAVGINSAPEDAGLLACLGRCFRHWLGAQVLDFELQRQLVPYMKDLVPLPGIYDQDFIAANQASRVCRPLTCKSFVDSFFQRAEGLTALCWPQEERANNVIKGNKLEQVETVRRQIREFKQSSGVDEVIVLWTANTERFAQVCAIQRITFAVCVTRSMRTCHTSGRKHADVQVSNHDEDSEGIWNSTGAQPCAKFFRRLRWLTH